MKARRIARPIKPHPIIAKIAHETAMQLRAQQIARPMRALFDQLATGEVYEAEGEPCMRMPPVDKSLDDGAEWCAIAPALLGWIDLWSMIAPSLPTNELGYLAARLQHDKPLTLRLVEKARHQFEATIAQIPKLPAGAIKAGILNTEIKWAMEGIE